MKEFKFDKSDIYVAMIMMKEANSKVTKEFERVLSGDEIIKYAASKTPTKSVSLSDYYAMNKSKKKAYK